MESIPCCLYIIWTAKAHGSYGSKPAWHFEHRDDAPKALRLPIDDWWWACETLAACKHGGGSCPRCHGATVENTIPRDMGFLRIGVASKELVASWLWAMIDGGDRGRGGASSRARNATLMQEKGKGSRHL